MEYSRIKNKLQTCPDTYVGALLIILLKRAIKIPVFKPGGLIALVKKLEAEE